MDPLHAASYPFLILGQTDAGLRMSPVAPTSPVDMVGRKGLVQCHPTKSDYIRKPTTENTSLLLPGRWGAGWMEGSVLTPSEGGDGNA